MRWSLPAGRFFGVPLRVHWSFLVLMAGLFVWLGMARGWSQAGWWAVTIGLLFGSVLLHELGHSLAAVGLGYGVRDITLLPIGGIARMERMARDPLDELLITAAGPLVNFALALGLALPLGMGWLEFRTLDLTGPYIASNLFWLNLVLGLFNLLPAFPMDGGRVLRAVLASFLGRLTATRVAVAVGQILAVLMVAAGLFLNWWLAVVGAFVFLAARAEGRSVVLEERMRGLTAGQAAVGNPAVLQVGSALQEARALARSGFQQDFPVVDAEGRPAGMLDRDALERGLAAAGPLGAVADFAVAAVTVEPGEELEEAARRLVSGKARAVVLVDTAGRVLGLLAAEQVQRAMAFRGPAAAANEERRGQRSSLQARVGEE